jgi:hypothetical protein
MTRIILIVAATAAAVAIGLTAVGTLQAATASAEANTAAQTLRAAIADVDAQLAADAGAAARCNDSQPTPFTVTGPDAASWTISNPTGPARVDYWTADGTVWRRVGTLTATCQPDGPPTDPQPVIDPNLGATLQLTVADPAGRPLAGIRDCTREPASCTDATTVRLNGTAGPTQIALIATP